MRQKMKHLLHSVYVFVDQVNNLDLSNTIHFHKFNTNYVMCPNVQAYYFAKLVSDNLEALAHNTKTNTNFLYKCQHFLCKLNTIKFCFFYLNHK